MAKDNVKKPVVITVPLEDYIKEAIKEYGQSKYRSTTAQVRKILEDWARYKGLV